MDIFQRLKEERGITIVLITHEPQVAEYGSRIIRFKDGHIVSDVANISQRKAHDELAYDPPKGHYIQTVCLKATLMQ